MSSTLTNNGTLAQVWLAANLDKKFNKHQSLQTDIILSSKEIAKAATTNETNTDHIGLRLSGHLLYGVVRIYSNKTKYLLDDISETLVKLKSTFKANPRQVTQALGSTVVSNVNNLVMQDTITAAELFYQEPLEFLSAMEIPEGLLNRQLQGSSMLNRIDPINANRNLAGTGASNFNAEAIPNIVNSQNNNNIDFFDDSLEIGRGYAMNLLENSGFGDHSQVDNHHGDDQDFDLDFDISGSMHTGALSEGTAKSHSSIGESTMPSQHGTIIQPEQNDGNISISSNAGAHDLSVEMGRNEELQMDNENPLFDMDLGLDDGGFNNITGPVEDNLLPVALPETSMNNTTFSSNNLKQNDKNSVLKNTKQILKDDQIEINSSEDSLNDNGNRTDSNEETAMLNTPENSPHKNNKNANNKRLLEQMYEQTYNYLPQNIYQNLLQLEKRSNKRQKTNNSVLEAPPSPNQGQPSDTSFNALDNSGFDISLNLGNGEEEHSFDSGDDFNMDIEGNDENNESSALDLHENSNILDEQTTLESSILTQKIMQADGQMVSKSTVEIANILRSNLDGNKTLAFSALLDLQPTSGTEITKTEASRTFFQILSLASADCISVKQESSFQEINITSKDELYEKFIAA